MKANVLSINSVNCIITLEVLIFKDFLFNSIASVVGIQNIGNQSHFQMNNSTAGNKTDLPYSRTPTPPPPPSKLTKSRSIVSYQYLECDAINFRNKALMPPVDNHYNCCPSINATSHTLDKKRQHKHKCRHHHHHQQHHHHHHHHQHQHQHHNHQHQDNLANNQTQQQIEPHLLRHHKSSPSIDLRSPQSQKPLKSSSSSLSFVFGVGVGGGVCRSDGVHCKNNHSTPKSSFKSPKSSSTRSSVSPRRSLTPSKWRNSSFHSCDDLDAAAAANKSHSLLSAEKKVVKSLKYLCACTGATLRNLSKRTKDLHAKNYYGYSEPTWRVWGEEREKDAIFTVYLKKVRYNRPTPIATSDADGEISHLAWETVRVRFVKAATLERLVEALATDDGELESTFINVFLSTYRTFSTPKEVLNLLIKRYETLHEKYLQELKAAYSGGGQQGAASIRATTIGGEEDSFIDSQRYSGSSGNYDDINYSDGSVSGSGSGHNTTSIHEQHKQTLVSALHVWLDGFPEDWNEENLRIILAFAAKRLPHSELHNKVHHRLERILRQQYERQQYCSIGGVSASDTSIATYCTNSILTQPYIADLPDQIQNSLHIAPVYQRRPPAHFMQVHRFPHVPIRHFAEQLTRMDSELFKRLIPHQCLGATWARRDRTRQDGPVTVIATINQFNAVLFRVISSILIEPRLKPQERSLYIAAWIDIAQELRLLKNFSSLKAIINALQSFAIYRLTKTWAALSKEKLQMFHELARIFSDDNNSWTQREVLMREGTAKFADTVGENDSQLQKIIQKQSTHTSQGTIPFLGMFLTDLTMIHTAIPDTIDKEGFINFDKKRKEFEVLAQLKLLQGAANTYNLREDHNFDLWFASMPVLDEREAHTLSYQFEAVQPVPGRKSGGGGGGTNTSLTNSTGTTVTTSSGNNSLIGSNGGGVCTTSGSGSNGHRKTDSIASTSSSGAGSQFYCEVNTTSIDSRYSSRHSSLDRDAQLQLHTSMLSASSSVSNLSLDSSNSGGSKLQQQTRPNSHNSRLSHSQSANGMQTPNHQNTAKNGSSPMIMINGQCKQTPDGKAPNFYIIRVTYETDKVELDGVVMYKSIMLGNNERAPQVIRNAMLKLGLEADPDQYTLAQKLPDKELVMPKDANVYYAVNTNHDLNFILRPKKSGASGKHTTSGTS